jgi:hypothetical protein
MRNCQAARARNHCTRVDLFAFDEMARLTRVLLPLQLDHPEDKMVWLCGQWDWRRRPAHAPPDTRLWLTEHTLYRNDDLSAPLPWPDGVTGTAA